MTGGPKLHVTWYKDGKPLLVHGKTIKNGGKYVSTKHGKSLKISRSDMTGSGMYRCLGSNMAGGDWGQSYLVNIDGR